MRQRERKLNLVIAVFTMLLMGATLPSADAEVRVPGGTASGGGSWGEQFLFDTGADETFISRACATAMGLLNDADGDGVPDASSGPKPFNGGAIQTWCFPNVAVAAISSAGQNCVTTGTVYVSQNAGDVADDSILGEPWQQAVDACYRARTQSTSWPWANNTATVSSYCVDFFDAVTGLIRDVFSNVFFTGAFGVSSANMIFMAGSDYSFLPASVAYTLGPVTGWVDLAVDDPVLLNRLSTASMNQIGQTTFDVVSVYDFDLGIGPSGGSVDVLVLDDANSELGIIGDNMLQGTSGGEEYFVIQDGAVESCALYYMLPDCNANKISDDEEIEDDPSLDSNDSGILDQCEIPSGACTLEDGSCVDVPASMCEFLRGRYGNDGSSCEPRDVDEVPIDELPFDELPGNEWSGDDVN